VQRHNNYLDLFPHINNRQRRIDVIYELVDYTPVEINELSARRNV